MCWLSKIVSLLGVPVYYFVYKKKKPASHCQMFV